MYLYTAALNAFPDYPRNDVGQVCVKRLNLEIICNGLLGMLL